ncbi:MAG: DUF3568 family protein [Phycisphaerales bacterium]|nr:DUF3568 family protein [Phycisphaerales bacterium]
MRTCNLRTIAHCAILPAALSSALLVSTMSGGCAAALVAGAAAAGIAGTYVYMEGRLESEEQAPLDEVYEASIAAMEDMEFPIKERAKDALAAHITALRADKSEVNITMEQKPDETTSLHIRVGVVGDEEVSSTILSRIREHLGTAGAQSR